ncbi:hypothetical protein ABZV92_18765 [Streptomyces rubiginosohelvolus]|uniref:hypothetical protein n=1 Tax=Streptomyces rubiginosohelvolus TaxID=67362 RepID=UPI0033ADA8B8
MTFKSRIEVPLGMSGEPDYTAPAGGLAVATMFIAMIAAAYFTLESQLLHNHRRVAYVVITAATVISSFGVFFAARAVFRRFGAHWWHLALATALLCCVSWAAPKTAAYIFPDQMERYHRELGGPGRCLNDTPYGSEDEFPKSSQIIYNNREPGRMTVNPIDKKFPPLRLDHAVRGGLHRLTPADAESSQILKSYGC